MKIGCKIWTRTDRWYVRDILAGYKRRYVWFDSHDMESFFHETQANLALSGGSTSIHKLDAKTPSESNSSELTTLSGDSSWPGLTQEPSEFPFSDPESTYTPAILSTMASPDPSSANPERRDAANPWWSFHESSFKHTRAARCKPCT